MAGNPFDIQIDEVLHRDSIGRIVEAEYHYKETYANGEASNYRVAVKRSEYERSAATTQKPTLPFQQFLKVLRPFMMGRHAADDIPEAFRLLDRDYSGTIDIGELAAFMPVIVPNANPYMLLHHIQKVDKNCDYKLNLQEFTDLIKRGIGRDIALGPAKLAANLHIDEKAISGEDWTDDEVEIEDDLNRENLNNNQDEQGED
ncbi:unnamed protein product [Rotaria sp. Silwood1]|nr:unnamed protein product [Rotaria sp. Silwood1]CAF1614894.1 unnamed protein product [Rotaria sp. Silwood1]CAF3773304.1 unnamed protein product [Rotaria sp. Silwood1]